MNRDKINPSSAYYIKLGRKGHYEKQGIEVEGTIRIGYREVPHEMALAGRWDEVKELFISQEGKSRGAATDLTRQVQTFYEAGEEVLWITFYKNRLYWCFAKKEIAVLPDNSKTRPTVDGWHSEDISGKPLDAGRLSGSLTSVQGYRGTICTVNQLGYLVRKINGERTEAEQAALAARAALVEALVDIIQSLHWKEFELLMDLIFRQAGWQRISQLGKTQKTLDLDLFSPITSERFLVQMKSRANRAEFETFREVTTGMEAYTRYYFVVHTPGTGLTQELETRRHLLWLPHDVAQLVVRYGLVDWVIDRAT
jgi:hypothetical protein